MSVLVSVADPLTPNSLLHPQFGLEAEVGIGQGHLLSPYYPVQSQLPHSQARRVTGNETACKMGVFGCFVKSPSTHH